MLEPELLKVGIVVNTWQEAIQQGGELLVKSGMVEQRYVEAMIDNVIKLGPYMVIAPKVAMPHARPQDGVLKTGISLLLLKEPVVFGERGEQLAQLVICLAALDNSSHLDLLKQIAEVIRDEASLALMLQATTTEELLNYFSK
ncbi:hypothetical protein GH741_13620 [Aquibacillus halophilus]|uniref:Ascorbate-specific PTS system EIIA component n=1 Tax=Aquibacillus halophilus TaxID=930132 RepID=A0A6A8DIY2_9BACI|nr:PTS sugar transporter subunit IIA [Aquibacillus halophilus]MRH43711.1 hypothetical protein [Aquibacillus halophilus]